MSETAASPSRPDLPRPDFSAPSARAKRPADLPDPLPGTDDIRKEASPFGDADWRVRVYTWCGFLLRLLLIGGAVVTALEYFAARDEKRVERALELVTLWEEPQYQDAQKALSGRLAALTAGAADLLGPNPSPRDQAILMQNIGRKAMSAEGGTMPLPAFREHFNKIVYFLNRLSFCVEGNICSREVSDAYFRDYALSFWSYFAGFVADERKRGAPTFAKPIEDYVRASGAGTPPAAAPVAPATPSDAAPAAAG